MKLKNVFREGTGYRLFFMSIVFMGLAGGIYNGILNNFLSDIVNIAPSKRGVVEFFRETPGFLLVLILAALCMFSSEGLYKIGAVIALVGMSMHAVVPKSMALVTVAICLYSMGEHIQIGMKSSITLQYAQPGNGGRALGLLGSVQQIGTLVGYILIIFAFMNNPSEMRYRIFFGVASVFVLASTALSMPMKGQSAQDKSKSRFYFRKKYFKYYMLEVFYGARKQVFLTFGPYVLIRHYGASTPTMSLLFAVSAVLCFIASPFVGKIIDKAGYKIVMIMDTVILVAVCFFYGYADHIFPKDIAFVICCVNYVLDAIISLASMASSVYVQDISDNDEEVRATLSTGISVNHLITLFIALFGGWVWETLGIETLFIISAILGLCNSAYAATIKTPNKAISKKGA